MPFSSVTVTAVLKEEEEEEEDEDDGEDEEEEEEVAVVGVAVDVSWTAFVSSSLAATTKPRMQGSIGEYRTELRIACSL